MLPFKQTRLETVFNEEPKLLEVELIHLLIEALTLSSKMEQYVYPETH